MFFQWRVCDLLISVILSECVYDVCVVCMFVSDVNILMIVIMLLVKRCIIMKLSDQGKLYDCNGVVPRSRFPGENPQGRTYGAINIYIVEQRLNMSF